MGWLLYASLYAGMGVCVSPIGAAEGEFVWPKTGLFVGDPLGLVDGIADGFSEGTNVGDRFL